MKVITMLRLETITPANLDAAIGLKVRPDQEQFVAPVVSHSPGVRASRHDLASPHPRRGPGGRLSDGVFDVDSGGEQRSGLWRLNIAAGEQGRGYGRFAVESVAAEIRRRGGIRMFVGWVPGEAGPERFYLKLGFRLTGETSGDEVVGELRLAGRVDDFPRP